MEEIIYNLIALIRKKMKEQGAYDRDAYKQFVEESINYYLERGKLSEDDNLKFIEDRLMEVYPSIRKKIPSVGEEA